MDIYSSLANNQTLIIQAILIFILTIVLHYFIAQVHRRVRQRAVKKHQSWLVAIFDAIYQPLLVLIWFIAILFTLDIIRIKTETNSIFKALNPIQTLGVLIILIWMVVRFVFRIEKLLTTDGATGYQFDKTSVSAISQIIIATVIVVGVLVAMQTMGYQISGILALGGIGGIVVGFAAKDTLANFFGGLMIYIDRPFNVGDWIRSPDRNIEGTIEYIGWRLCRIRTFDSRPLYVPNSIFSTISVENPSRMRNRRINTTIGVRYDDADKLPIILQEIRDMLRQHDAIDTNCTLMVNLVELGASSLNFMVYTFTKTTHWVTFQEIQEDIFFKILAIIAKNGAQTAFPTTAVSVPNPIQLKNI